MAWELTQKQKQKRWLQRTASRPRAAGTQTAQQIRAGAKRAERDQIAKKCTQLEVEVLEIRKIKTGSASL